MYCGPVLGVYETDRRTDGRINGSILRTVGSDWRITTSSNESARRTRSLRRLCIRRRTASRAVIPRPYNSPPLARRRALNQQRQRRTGAAGSTPAEPPRRTLPNPRRNHGNGIRTPEMRPSLSTLLPFITLDERAATRQRQTDSHTATCTHFNVNDG